MLKRIGQLLDRSKPQTRVTWWQVIVEVKWAQGQITLGEISQRLQAIDTEIRHATDNQAFVLDTGLVGIISTGITGNEGGGELRVLYLKDQSVVQKIALILQRNQLEIISQEERSMLAAPDGATWWP